MSKARELLYTGNLIDADEAKRLDLVNEVVPADELDAAVERHALTIAKLPAVTVEYNKKLINMSYELMGVRQVVERSMELEAAALASKESSPEIDEFNEIRAKDGLKAALSWNAARFTEEDAWFKKSRERG
jgi:enoyl-CoA hydratase/carnithine racemase